jgi:uncharacterized membrane protein
MIFAFALGIALLFGFVLAFENRSEGHSLQLRPAGLVTWLVSGNWPAKVGAGLLIISSGALLRYLMLNIEFPPNIKLLAGVAISGALGIASGALGSQHRLRAIHLALGGASLGVAYLTAYSAYGFLKLVGEIEALGGLFIVAVAATAFAVSTRAISIAMLAMVGAFVAPAFALEQPDPTILLRYYLLASLLVLFMVWKRGWRPLIHLSFLFTLSGGAFFGWMQGLYASAVYQQVHLLLLLNIALHLAMPLAEAVQGAAASGRNNWLRRFDLGYFLLLPLVALVLMLSIAPDARREGALGLAELAVVWTGAAGLQQLRFRTGAKRFFLVATLFLSLSVLLWLDNLPYFLIGAVVACAFLAAGRENGVPDELEGVLSAAALVCTAGYLLHALGEILIGTPVFNTAFVRHSVLVLALALAGWRLKKQGSRLAAVFLTIAVTWLFVSCSREVLRLHLDHFPQLAYLTLLGLTFLYTASAWWRQPSTLAIRLLAATHFLGGFISANGFPTEALLPLMLASHLAFSLLAMLTARYQIGGRKSAGEVRSLLPLLMLPWAIAFNEQLAHPNLSAVMTLLVCGALSASLQGQWVAKGQEPWPNPLSPLGFVLAGAWLFFQTLIHIERGAWAIACELITLAYLLQSLRAVQTVDDRDNGVFKAIAAFAALSVVLANILRCLGPNRILSILDFNELLLPAVTSLVLASVGALITWASVGQQSRRLWVSGAAVLAGAALKLVFLDFGSLGQLGNILAMMGAGAVFMLVAWLVPIPPKAMHAPADELESDPTISSVDAADFQDTLPNMAMQSANAERPAPTPAATANAEAAADTLKSLQRARERLEQSREAAAASGGNQWVWILVGLLAFAIYANHPWRTRKSSIAVPTNSISQAEKLEESEPTLAATPAPAQLQVLAPDKKTTQLPPLQPHCGFQDLILPSDAIVLAAGAYGGRPIGFQIDQSGHEATQIDVMINQPGKSVVMMLGAYEPTVWNVSWTADTKITAVLTSGYHRQVLAGLEAGVPTVISTADNKGICGYFYVDADNLSKLNPMAQRAFGRDVDMVYPSQNGTVLVGKAGAGVRWISSDANRPASYFDKSAPLAGKAGLDDAISKGLLRLATAADFDAWADAMAASAPTLKTPPIAGQPTSQRRALWQSGYVVKPGFVYPSGLFGAHAVTFIIPRGIPRPKGNPGHSTILDFNLQACDGPSCGNPP